MSSHSIGGYLAGLSSGCFNPTDVLSENLNKANNELLEAKQTIMLYESTIDNLRAELFKANTEINALRVELEKLKALKI